MIYHQCIPLYYCKPSENGRCYIIVILFVLYCNVFSPVNKTCGNLTALHSILHCRLSWFRWFVSDPPVCVHVLEEVWLWRVMALFHCMVRHGTVRYGSLLGGFPLGTVPGTWYFFSTTSAEVPSEPYRYQNATCKLCWSLIGRRESSLLRHWTCDETR